MKKLALFLAVAIVLCYSSRSVFTQNASNPSVAPAAGGSSSAQAIAPGGGKISVPPERVKAISVGRLSAPITIDGHIDEDAWKGAAVFKDFYQTQPGYNTPASKPTEAYLMYDE